MKPKAKSSHSNHETGPTFQNGREEGKGKWSHQPPPFDECFVERLSKADESIAAGETDSRRDESSVKDAALEEFGKLTDCLRLVDRVRRHAPGCLADLVQEDASGSLWIGSDDECPAKIGRFEIRRKLGQGGFGLVFLAFDPQLERDIALKVPRIEALVAEQTRERFLREGKAAAGLNHANIATVYEAGKIGPICYIASAYCEGGTLAGYLKQCQSRAALEGSESRHLMNPRALTSLVLALADAVHHAHSRGILHRDVKPSNILFDVQPTDDGDLAGSARLVDFGLAKTLDSDEDYTQTGILLGTPAYMSPEQAEGDTGQVGVGSDVYSIGAILYELLTGAPPLKKPNDLETLVAIKTEEPTPPRRLNKNCHSDLEAICLKCLEKSPDRRYRTAAELGDDLKRFLNGQPVVARTLHLGERWGRWMMRNPLLSTMIGAVVSLLLLLAIGSTTAAFLLASANKTSLEQLANSIDAEQESTKSKQLAIGALYEAYKSESRAIRFSGRVGQRIDSLKTLENAAQRVPQLGLGETERLVLRNGAIASLARVDLSLDQRWPGKDFELISRLTDLDGEYYAGRYVGRTISVRRMLDNHEVARLDSAEPILGQTIVRFSPDRQFIAARSRNRNGTILNVWRVDSTELIRAVRLSHYPNNSFDFSPNSRRLAVVHLDGSIEMLSGQRFETSRIIACEIPAKSIRFDPTGSRLAVVRASQTDILNLENREIIQTFRENFQNLDYSALDWSPNGQLLAVTCSDRMARIWNIETGELHGQLHAHGGEVTHISFHPAGKLIATSSYDGKTKIWNVEDCRELLEADSLCTHFSRDGRWLCGRAERWRLFDSSTFHRRLGSRWQEIHPNGRVAIATGLGTWWLVNTHTDRRISPIIQGCASFNQSGSRLIHFQRDQENTLTVCRLCVETQEDGSRVTMDIGSPHEIARIPVVYWNSALGESMLAVTNRIDGDVYLVNIKTGKTCKTASRHRKVGWIDWSSDDRMVATGTRNGKNVKIWDAATGKLMEEHSSGSARVRFSPNAKVLVMGENHQFSFRRVGNGIEESIKSIGKNSVSLPGAIEFSPDGMLVALAEKFGAVRLFDTTNLSELATMTVDAGDEIDHVEFSPDVAQLLVTARRRSYIWNLRNVQTSLAKLRLDWGKQPAVEPVQVAAKELKIEIALGDMAIKGSERSAQPIEKAESFDDFDEYDQTLRHLRQLAESAPDDATIQMQLAWLIVNGPDDPTVPNEILTLVHSDVSSAPRDWKKLTALGLAFLQLGKFAEAAEALENAHRCTYRETPSVHLLLLATAYHRLGNNSRAELNYEGALEWMDLMKERIPSWRIDQLNRVQQELLIPFKQLGKRNSFQSISEVARNARLAKLEKASKFVDQRPDHQHGWWARGRELFALGRWSAAILECEVAIEIAPEVHHAYFWRASSWMAKYDHDKAIADFTKSLSIHTKDAWPMRHLAFMYAIDPQPRDLDKALSLINKAHAMKPDHPEVLDVHGIVLYRHGRFEEALKHLEQADIVAPRRPLFLYFIAMCHHRLGRTEKAKQYFLRAEVHKDDSHANLQSLIRTEAQKVLERL